MKEEKRELITVDPQEITLFAEEAGKLVFKPQAEEELVKLLTIKELIEKAIEGVKKAIGEAGIKINPNFRGVQGAQVSCIYRKFGSKYNYDFTKKSICEPFLKRKEYFSVDSNKVDEYIEKVGELPEGIFEAEREKTLTLNWRGGETNEN